MKHQKRRGSKKSVKTSRKARKLAAEQSRESNLSLKQALHAEQDEEAVLYINPTPPSDKPRGRGDSGRMLTDPHHIRGDLQELDRAVRKGWNIRRKTALRRRLEAIAAKTEGQVVTKLGLITSETKGDELAIAAIKVLAAMDAQDLAREKQFREAANPSSTPTTAVQVNVTNVSSDPIDIERRRVELLGLANKLGAREVIINGETVKLTGDNGPADDLPPDEVLSPKAPNPTQP